MPLSLEDPVRLRYCLLEPGCSAFRCSLANQPETAHVHLLGCGRQKDAPGLAAQLQLESSVLEIVDQLGHLQSPKRKQEELSLGGISSFFHAFRRISMDFGAFTSFFMRF